MTNWYVGQRVRCKDVSLISSDGSPWRMNETREMVLIEGAEYTVRGVNFCTGHKTTILLQGIHRRYWSGREAGWRTSRFEPVQTTSIESLRSLLNPSPEDIDRVLSEDSVTAQIEQSPIKSALAVPLLGKDFATRRWVDQWG